MKRLIVFYKILIVFSLILFTSGKADASKCSCLATGDWLDVSIWNCGRLPATGDTIVIPLGMRVTVASSTVITGSPLIIDVFGEFYFPNGRKLTLPAGSSVILRTTGWLLTGGGGGLNEQLQIGPVPVWTAACNCGNCTVDCSNIHGYRVLGAPILSTGIVSIAHHNAEDRFILTWTTGDEKETNYFIVESSPDGKVWNESGRVKAGPGNYTFTEICNGNLYYRLSELSTSGHSGILEIISSDCRQQVSFLLDNETRQLKIENFILAQITDLNGNILVTSSEECIPVSHISGGLYLLVINRENTIEKHKLVLR